MPKQLLAVAAVLFLHLTMAPAVLADHWPPNTVRAAVDQLVQTAGAPPALL